jgi:hypothetical protein
MVLEPEEEWQKQLEKEREFMERLGAERARWEQEEIKRRRVRKFFLAGAAFLALAVMAFCGINWWVTSVELSDAREQAAYWEAIYYSESHQSHFDSLWELEKWLAEDDTNYNPEHLTTGALDCDDYALTLQKHALQDGHILSVHLFDSDGDGSFDHMANIAVIGNDVYQIEPQGDHVVHLIQLD